MVVFSKVVDDPVAFEQPAHYRAGGSCFQ